MVGGIAVAADVHIQEEAGRTQSVDVAAAGDAWIVLADAVAAAGDVVAAAVVVVEAAAVVVADEAAARGERYEVVAVAAAAPAAAVAVADTAGVRKRDADLLEQTDAKEY